MVYYRLTEDYQNDGTAKQKIGYMCPYLEKHGRPCHFIDDKIVEISSIEMMQD